MSEIIDFNNCQQSLRVYGGSAGRKNGIIYNGKYYIVKFPGSTSKMKNVQLSYINSPLCEYLGSHIYEFLDIPVHKTILGIKDQKLVVACEDFLLDTDRLYEFMQIKVTFSPNFVDSSGEITNGTGSDLQEILLTIEQHPITEKMTNLTSFFWDMFIVDALIGNPDRNNGNWGLIFHNDNSFTIAPVYDNGNSFHNKWDNEKIQNVLQDNNQFLQEAYKARMCIFTTNDKRINPYNYIKSQENEGCNQAVKRLLPRILENQDKIITFIETIPENHGEYVIISPLQKEFFIKLLQTRINDIFIPTYERL